MPRRARYAPGGVIYHVLNRGSGRMRLFGRPGDYEAFLELLAEAAKKFPGVRILAFCLMPNHWHLVLWPSEDGELSRFMFWLTMTHVQRWRHARKVVGLGPLYQGRFKAFAVQTDEHLLIVMRYVERNALRAALVSRAEAWQWCSLAIRLDHPTLSASLLRDWPVEVPSNWVQRINQAQTPAEVEAMRRSIRTGRPFGTPAWQQRMARAMGVELQPRRAGRPTGSRDRKKRSPRQKQERR